METRLDKDKKVAHQLPKVAWRDSAIDKLKITHSKLKLNLIFSIIAKR